VADQDEWVARVSERIQDFLSERASEMGPLGPDVVPFDTFARQFLNGGKRFRALCTILGFRIHGASVTSNVIDMASALEIFHAAALVHDDIMDNSDTRRGQPSAHRAFESVHSGASWAGDPASFGVNSALLFGDLLLAYSDELVNSALDDADRNTRLRTRAEFDRMRREVTMGQYLDIVEERAWPRVDSTDALDRAGRVVVYKSAKYSIEAPLLIGAVLGGASERDVDTLRAFGLPLGFAFQLRDDVLGVFGDPAVTGKPAGDDIREGKRTVLIALAMSRVSASEQRLLNELLGDRSLSAEQVRVVQNTLESCGARDEVESLITDYVAQAHAAIETSDFDESSQTALRDLVAGVTNRVS
jgi:geranylgeranyl diphosphate synthase, type I